jgi:hypothetical protein
MNSHLNGMDQKSLMLMSLNLIWKVMPFSEREARIKLLLNQDAFMNIFSFCVKNESSQVMSLFGMIVEKMFRKEPHGLGANKTPNKVN